MNFAITFCFIIESILSNLHLSNHNNLLIQDSLKSNGIELIISNIKNTNGLIRIGVYSSLNGYPDNPQYSFSPAKDTIKSGKLHIFIPLKDPGNYAISILDDENSNGKMDYLFKIMPKEGFGFSNNPKITGRKPPSFEQTSFLFEKGKMKISVRMIYI